MNHLTLQYYQQVYNQLESAGALSKQDLKFYNQLLALSEKSPSQMEDLGALTRQGRHYIVTGEVRYVVGKEFLTEQEIISKIRSLLGNGLSLHQKGTLVDILQIAENKTIIRTDIRKIERIFALEDELEREKKAKV